MRLRVNGVEVDARPNHGFLDLERSFAAGDRVEGLFTDRIRLLTPDGREIPVEDIGGTPQRGALYCGPDLMGMDEAVDEMFFSEPWPGNVITLPSDLTPSVDAEGHLRLNVTYEHEGYRGTHETALKPMGEKPAEDQRTFAVWLNFRRD